MSTWVEIGAEACGEPREGKARGITAPATSRQTTVQRDRYEERRGTVIHSFPQRLSRARMLYLRRRESIGNWLALSIALAHVVPVLLAGSSISGDFARESVRASPDGNSFRAPENGRDALQSTPKTYR